MRHICSVSGLRVGWESDFGDDFAAHIARNEVALECLGYSTDSGSLETGVRPPPVRANLW